MTRTVAKQKDPSLLKQTLSLPLLIDILVMVYITSIYLLSYSTALNLISKALAFVLMALLAIYMLMKSTLKMGGLFVSFGLFTAFCLLSCLWAVDTSVSFDKTLTIVQLFVLAILLYNYLQKEKKAEYLITALGIAATVFSVYTVLYFGVDEYFKGLEDGVRMGSEITNVNSIGMSAATASTIALWKVIYNKKYLYLISIFICVVVAFGSGSRKALIFVILSFVLLFVLKGNSKKKLRSLLQAAVILAILYAVLQLPMFSTVNARFDSFLNFFEEDGYVDRSTIYRMTMIEAGWEQFLKTPFTGVGIGNSGYITLQVVNTSTYLHNNYIELLATTGILGTVFYYLMYVIPSASVIRQAIKQNKYAILSLTLMIIQLVMHFGAVQYYSKTAYIYIVLFFLVADMGKEEKKDVVKN